MYWAPRLRSPIRNCPLQGQCAQASPRVRLSALRQCPERHILRAQLPGLARIGHRKEARAAPRPRAHRSSGERPPRGTSASRESPIRREAPARHPALARIGHRRAAQLPTPACNNAPRETHAPAVTPQRPEPPRSWKQSPPEPHCNCPTAEPPATHRGQPRRV
jgi:hypothetical protein